MTVTPLNPNARRHLTSLRTGRPLLSRTASADGAWAYVWLEDEDGTPWEVTHLPTGLTQPFSSLARARRWTATPSAVDLLRVQAVEILTATFALPEQRRTATQALVTLEGFMPRDTAVDSVCRCGGYLTALVFGVVHVDTCDECLAGNGLCDVRERPHRVCPNPAAVQCDHPRCVHPNEVTTGRVCELDHRFCCGCCHGER